MPPLRRRTVKSTKEEAIEAALTDYIDGKYPSIRATATAHDVDRSTLSRQLRGSKSRSEAHRDEQLLSMEQEEAIVRLWLKLDGWGNPLKLPFVRALATHMQSPENSRPPGEHWITRFLDHHPIIASKIATRIDRQRTSASDPIVLAHFYKMVLSGSPSSIYCH